MSHAKEARASLYVYRSSYLPCMVHAPLQEILDLLNENTSPHSLHLYGTWPFFLVSASLDRATITLPRARRPLLMWVASFSSLPVSQTKQARSSEFAE
jgi:hypothetical protein